MKKKPTKEKNKLIVSVILSPAPFMEIECDPDLMVDDYAVMNS